MRYQSYLHTAIKIISAYKGEEPLSAFLKKFFAADKKYGSGDRKNISSLCYNYYRAGRAMDGMSLEKQLLAATFLCNHSPNNLLRALMPEWEEKIMLPPAEKAAMLGIDLANLFPFAKELSGDIDASRFALSFLQQPDLFLRIRPGKRNAVETKLQAAAIPYELSANTVRLANASRIHEILSLDKEAVVQDKNSQRVLDGVQQHMGDTIPHAWDCCAASGGKSILLYDKLQGKVKITVSDIRESILVNLKKRFSIAGIRQYDHFTADLDHNERALPLKDVSLIICDAPCTGSGTWARTPEQLYFFDAAQIAVYAQRQERIASAALPYLEEGGLLVYITCSVFRQENEAVVDYIQKKFHLQLLQMESLKGYDDKADSMFVALLKK